MSADWLIAISKGFLMGEGTPLSARAFNTRSVAKSFRDLICFASRLLYPVNMNGTLQDLLRLQRLDFGEHPKNASQAAALRAAIPATMLERYERRRALGKKAIALVRNRVCTSCRMQVPIGVVATLMRGTVTQVCGNCGLYLCLPETPETPVVEAPVVAKPLRKARKPRALVQQV